MGLKWKCVALFFSWAFFRVFTNYLFKYGIAETFTTACLLIKLDQSVLFLRTLWASGRPRSVPFAQLFCVSFLIDALMVSAEPPRYGSLYLKISVFLVLMLPFLHQSDPFCFPIFQNLHVFPAVLFPCFLPICYLQSFYSLFFFCVDLCLTLLEPCKGRVVGRAFSAQASLLYFFG